MRGDRDLLERLADKFTVGDGCWEWRKPDPSNGYGRLKPGGRGTPTVLAHHVVYELMVGPIPAGLQLDHVCRQRACVRPDHLEPVTQRENILRGEGFAGRNARKTHCPQGHPYDEANTYRIPSRPNARYCRACWRKGTSS